jgi:hypothetical protein
MAKSLGHQGPGRCVMSTLPLMYFLQMNTFMIGSFEFALPPPEPKYATLMIGTIPIKYEVT